MNDDTEFDRLAKESFSLAAQHEHVRHELERLALRGTDESLELWELAEVVGRLADAELRHGHRVLAARRGDSHAAA